MSCECEKVGNTSGGGGYLRQEAAEAAKWGRQEGSGGEREGRRDWLGERSGCLVSCAAVPSAVVVSLAL
jgi:hypothetical protein